jgi:hypothetical protein
VKRGRVSRWGGNLLLLALLWAIHPAAGAQETAVILADPADPFYALAQEMAVAEGLALVDSLDEALAREPVYLLWVVSPGRLSDQALVEFGQAMQRRAAAVSAGIITGSSLERARALWRRAAEAGGEQVYAANAANPAGHIEAGIVGPKGDSQPLTKATFLDSLAAADYLTFTGHGSQRALYLQEGVAVRAADLPNLGPVVVATGSCNTFRPWEEGSIALALADRGAAAYAGFAYSPNEGYLLGEFEGLPLRYTWPEFPIGHAVQVQNRGTVAGFAAFPYYFLLGDPRLALQAEAPYRLLEERTAGNDRIQRYAGAPAGVIPVRLPGGARYSFVEIEGVAAGWQGAPFYNSRLQMVDVGPDKFLLFEHQGGDFILHLRARPSWSWVAGDVLLDSLDNTLLYLQDHGGALIMLVVGGLALLAVLFLLIRRRASLRSLALAALFGLGAAALHALYALARLDAVTITSKNVTFGALAPVSTFLLVTCAAFLYLNARSRGGRAVALAVATLPAWAPAVLLLVILAVADDLLVGSRLGTGLWNCRMALQPLIALPVLGLALAAGLAWLRRAAGGGPETAGDGTRPARDTGSEGAAWPAAAVPAARVLFALNAVVWIGLGIASLVRLGSAPAGMVGVGGVVVVLMFGNAAAMAWLALVLGGRRAVWYWAAVAVVAVNALLSVADDFGLLDLAVLLLDGALLTLLLAARTRFLPEQKRKTDGEAKADERRHSF